MDQSGRHPVNVGHLVMGLAFLGLLVVWALIKGDVVTGDDVRWLLPIPWVTAGIAGLAVFALRQRPDPGLEGRQQDASTLGE
jgi:hypothetical protein